MASLKSALMAQFMGSIVVQCPSMDFRVRQFLQFEIF